MGTNICWRPTGQAFCTQELSNPDDNVWGRYDKPHFTDEKAEA